MGLLGPNADGELLEPGRVADCYLGLLLRAHDPDQAPGVLVISPAELLHPAVPQPDGTLLYELVTGHPDRQPSSWCSWLTSRWSYAPGPMAPGPSSASTPRRPPAPSSAAGGTATSRASSTGG